MPGTSDSGHPDDVKLHLDTVLAANKKQEEVPDGESDEGKIVRESVLFPAKLQERLEKALTDLNAQLPGLSAAEVNKLTATRAGRDALSAGIAALGRVDDHLQSVTGKRNPVEGKLYGVYGENPTTFAGVLRSLSMCIGQEADRAKLDETDAGRELLFTKLIAQEVEKAHATMSALVGTKATTRGDLARGYNVKAASLKEALSALVAARQHLYANLPDRKQDDDLIDYGFRPIAVSTGRKPKDQDDEDEGGDTETPTEQPPT